MKYFSIFIVFLCLFFTLVKSQSGNQTDGCMPSNCQATCTPACSTGKTCVLGTMKLCGQCPISTCIDNSILGPSNPNGSSPNNSNNGNNNNGPDGGMIGGLVGGLVGGGLLIGIIVYYFLRKQNKKKQGLPFVSATPRLGTATSFHSPNNALSQRSVTPINGNHPMSSIISHHSHLPPPPSPLQNVQPIQEKLQTSLISSQLQSQQQEQLNEKDISLSQLQVPLPSSSSSSSSSSTELHDINRTSIISSQLRPTSTSSFLSEDDDDSSLGSVSQRGSTAIATTITPAYRVSHQATKSATAFQVTRIKPQIMRVNTVRVLDSPTPGSNSSNSGNNNNLSRSGSVRTILTRDNSITSNLSRSNTAPSRPRNKNNNNNNNDKKSDDNNNNDDDDDSTMASPRSTTSPHLISSRRISAPLLSPSQINPFHDRHSVIEENEVNGDKNDDDLSDDESKPELKSVNLKASSKDV